MKTFQFSEHFRYSIIPRYSKYYIDYYYFIEQLIDGNVPRTEDFFSHLEKEIFRCSNFVGIELIEIKRKLSALSLRSNYSHFNDFDSNDQLILLASSSSNNDLKEEFFELYFMLRELIAFVQLNRDCVKDIYKNIQKNLFFENIPGYKTIVLGLKEKLNDVELTETHLEDVFSATYSKGSKNVALHELMYNSMHYTTDSSSFKLGFFLGLFVPLLLVDVLLNVDLPPMEETPGFLFTFPLFRLMIASCVLLWLWGLCLVVFRRTKLNYVVILGLKGRITIRHTQVFKIAALLSVIASTCYWIYLQGLSFEFGIHHSLLPRWISYHYIPLTGALCFLGILVIPMHVFHFTSRFVLLKSLKRCILSPFCEVQFMDSFIADIMTSFSKVLIDILFLFCYLFSGGIVIDAQLSSSLEGFYSFFSNIVVMLPYFWRFFQCCRAYHDTKEISNVFNCLKYFLSLLSLSLASIHRDFPQIAFFEEFWLFITVLASIYSYFWDLKMDWGLLTDEGPLLLRKNLFFKTNFVYYFAIVFDGFGRFFWIFSIYPRVLGFNNQYIIVLLLLIELLRRMIWAIFRIEHACVKLFT
eukprot:TRINITY_DN523_c0_g1_i1.p1 TRINITY_DN523_c0_g1~~TRINITY_DN523_c0_g1_i1.p1  ORF type:complete len:582 (+),score=85.78 TRINITY_DN523_c0_g1_i1:100-1845(+)